MSLAAVREFIVPLELVDQTLNPLVDAGRKGFEAFVLWGGQLHEEGQTFTFVTAYFPDQTTSSSEDGLLVMVQGDALFRVNRAFYERSLILAAQVHSHPTRAYHSETDDTYPLMTLVGGLSAVVPHFGRGRRDALDQWAWYRLVGPKEWAALGPETTLTFVE